MGSLSLLQEILPTQVSNWGLLHCRWILYQRSYHGFEKPSLKCIGISFLVDSQGLVHVQSSRKRRLLSNHLNKKGVIHIWKIILLGHILPVIKFTHFKEKNSMIFKVNCLTVQLSPRCSFRTFLLPSKNPHACLQLTSSPILRQLFLIIAILVDVSVPGVGNGNPLQYSRLENSMARGVWWASVRGVAESQKALATEQ